MSQQFEVEVNTEQIIAQFESLKSGQQKAVFRSALGKASAMLVAASRKVLRTVLKPGATKTPNRWDGKTMESGISRNVWKNAKGAKVNIMGDFRLKFFEMGTAERSTFRALKKRKPSYKGKIKASHFFQQAKQMTQEKIFAVLNQIIAQNIVKKWMKTNKPIMKNVLNTQLTIPFDENNE